MKEYVLGFAFSVDKREIVLIKKNKPDWQKGKFNGVGGKLEETDESIHSAMAREFKEETGVETYKEDWMHFGSMTFENDVMGGTAKVYLFKLFSDRIRMCKTMEEEKVEVFRTEEVFEYYEKYEMLMHNLPILLRLALSTEFSFTDFKQ